MTFEDANYNNTLLRSAKVKPNLYKRVAGIVRTSPAIRHSLNRGDVLRATRQIAEFFKGFVANVYVPTKKRKAG